MSTGEQAMILANSGDSHCLEPQDLWRDSLPVSLAERAPRSEWEGSKERVFVDNVMLMRDQAAVVPFRPPGAYDAPGRLADLDDQGIRSELIFPSMALWIYRMTDPTLARECARVYNDWCYRTFDAVSSRLIGVATLSALDTTDAVTELRRAHALGFKAALLPTEPAPDRLYNSDVWEPLWEAANELAVPLCFHIGTGGATVVVHGAGGAIINYVETTLPAQRVVASLVGSGVLDRHRALRVFVAEGGASWLPALADRMDEAYRQHGKWIRPPLSEIPSEYVRRQVYASFQHDRSAIAVMSAMGYSNIMWGTDYPHLEGTWPNTQAVLRDLFDGVAEDVRERIAIGAFDELFGTNALSGR